MKKILACALLLGVSTVNAGWLTNKIKSAATKVKEAAKKVHNSSVATELRNKVKSEVKKVYSQAIGKVSGNYGLPYKIMSTVKKLRKATQNIENNYGATSATIALIALCEECEAKPIRVMRNISDISNYIGEMEKLTDENASQIIPKESTDSLLEYMRELNNLVYEYSLPYTNNIKEMLNEATKIQGKAQSEEIRSYAEELAKISDDCLKDTEYLEENIDTMTMLISKLQSLYVNVSTLSTCLTNLKNLINSMQTLVQFKATGQNLVQTAKTTATDLQQTVSKGTATLVNSENSAVQNVTGLVDSTVENAQDYAQEVVGEGTEYMNNSANGLNQSIEGLAITEEDSANSFNEAMEVES